MSREVEPHAWRRRVYLWAYSNTSRSSRELASALGIRRLRHSRSGTGRPFNSTARPRVVINWGRGIDATRVVNNPRAVSNTINKHTAFLLMRSAGISIPDFTSTRYDAESWLQAGHKIVCRETLTGHEGQGITIHEQGPLPDVPLYVKYIPKKKEFRVHVCNNKVFDIQQKVLRRGTIDPSFEVRNTANGFIFQRQGIIVPSSVSVEAIGAIRALGLDFGAVDVIWNESQDKAYALEVNTAPGLEGSSVANYARVIRELIQERFGSSG